MSERDAAGRKTDPAFAARLRQELQLSTQLEILTAAMRTAVARADETTRDGDESGHYRDAEIDHAIQLADASAKLGLAISKIGAKFDHTITVRRDKTDDEGAATASSDEPSPYQVPTSHSDPLMNSRCKAWWAEEAAIDAEFAAQIAEEAKKKAERAALEAQEAEEAERAHRARKTDGGTPLA
jgi:hypothetical protein